MNAIIERPLLQRCLLVCFIVWLFWDGLFAGIPRADQVIFFHHIRRFDSLKDILVAALGWNRSVVAGDQMLYRPVLFLLLGYFYYLFGYNFVAWQIAGLLLHAGVVCGLHMLLSRGSLGKTLFPFLISMAFASSFAGAELVVWNHLVGYLLFSFLVVAMVYLMVRYCSSRKTIYAAFGLFAGIVAEFTYELGVVANVLVALFFILRDLEVFFNMRAGDMPQNRRRSDCLIGGVFIFGASLYPVVSCLDFIVRGCSISNLAPIRGSDLVSALGMAFHEIVFWIGGWLFPTWYNIVAGGRATFTGFNVECSLIKHLNFSIAALLFLCGATALTKRKYSWLRPGVGLGIAFAFLFAYAYVIAVGRGIPRGLDYVLTINVYYGYMACLVVVTGIALATVIGPDHTTGCGLTATVSSHVGEMPTLHLAGTFTAVALAGLIAVNAVQVAQFNHTLRFDFALPLQSQVDKVNLWLQENSKDPDAYFMVSDGKGQIPLDWMVPYFRNGFSGQPFLVDALFPEHSYRLNRSRIRHDNPVKITDVCRKSPVITASSYDGSYGPDMLLDAGQPGWHAATPVTYPQELMVDLQEKKTIRALSFLPQDGHKERFLRAIEIYFRLDGASWSLQARCDNICNCADGTGWSRIELPEVMESRFLRIKIFSNCGDDSRLTLRGLYIE
ncbi:MAG: discoidin domain-containing protein [Pseudomonadota bacterium]